MLCTSLLFLYALLEAYIDWISKAYRSGVTYATTSLSAHSGPIAGLSTTFRTAASHALELGAMIQDVTALHVSVRRQLGSQAASISSTIATLRRLLLGGESKETETGRWFDQAAKVCCPSGDPRSFSYYD